MRQASFVLIGIAILYIACKPESKRSPEAVEITFTGYDSTINFEGSETGKLPAGWLAATSEWKAATDETNSALKMEKNDGSAFNIAVVKGKGFKNLVIEARVKAITGNVDQGGGLVWRYIDKRNYYIIRANPLENNIRLYKVIDGSRKQMKSEDLKINAGEWFTIKVIANRDRIDCFYNGEKVFDASDDTFTSAGLVGFWSKADAVSLFDDLKIQELN